MKKKLAIFASGGGTNAENIVKYFAGSETAEVSLILSNKPDAYVLERARRLGIESLAFSKADFFESDRVVQLLKAHKIDWVILAGFLWLVPGNLLEAFPDRIINIHPSLLPKFGGKGMYGGRVHEAVVAAGESSSGITIHLVNQEYDKGRVLFQASCPVLKNETPETLADKIHALEYQHYPSVIEKEIAGRQASVF